MKTLIFIALIALLHRPCHAEDSAFGSSESAGELAKRVEPLSESESKRENSLSALKFGQRMADENDVIEVAINTQQPPLKIAPRPVPAPVEITPPPPATPPAAPAAAPTVTPPPAPATPPAPPAQAAAKVEVVTPPPAPATVATPPVATPPANTTATTTPLPTPTIPRAAVQYKICQGELPPTPEVAVILSNDRFYPSHIKLIEGLPTRLMFATTNRKPAALIIERLKVQRWIAKDPKINMPQDQKNNEINRELVTNRVTEVTFEPKRGTYSFHDAVTGATGELLVE